MNKSQSAAIEADYVIIGAGSAGCVLANRLSADGRSRVVLLEAGVDDRLLPNIFDPAQVYSNINIHLPAGFTRMLKDPRLNWNYMTEPEAETGGRQHAFPRGKVLGGSSAINGMLYVRGLPEDFDGWRQHGCEGWGWHDVQPYFERAERHEGDARSDQQGMLAVRPMNAEHPLFDAMIAGFAAAGAPVVTDINGTTQEGVARVSLNQRKGLRVSSAGAYLHPARHRDNLQVLTGAHAERIIFAGQRATGVVVHRGGEQIRVSARQEVIIASGAINSPQLLELSGIGDPGRLAALGIAVVASSPHVGENLQDHYACMVRARMKPGSPGFNELSRGVGLAGQMIRWAFTRTGALTQGGSNLTAFLKSNPSLDLPDLQFFASPATMDFEALAQSGQMTMEVEPGVTIGGYVMRPRSRGSVHATSADFRASPSIRPNYLSDPEDLRIGIEALKWGRRVMQSAPMARYFDHELTPGAAADSDEALMAFMRAAGSTAYHQSSTCAMGVGPHAVVSPSLQVNGVAGLRVVDASVMPNVVSGNTHAATVMIAEKASDLILAAR